jgi:transcriptional regulator with XRE-family HTH domain
MSTLLTWHSTTGTVPQRTSGARCARNGWPTGWSLREFHARTGVDIGHASRIETGKAPPTETVAKACDAAWPERRGWFLEYYEESKSWVPAGFRNWAEYEDKAATLRDWYPGIITGLLQTEDYARRAPRRGPQLARDAALPLPARAGPGIGYRPCGPPPD